VSTVTGRGGLVVVRVDGQEFLVRVQEIFKHRGSA
jgi:hypothetical protein